MRIIITIALVGLGGVLHLSYSQERPQDYSDSLKQVYDSEITDSLKTQALIAALEYYDLDNIDTSFQIARKVFQRATENKDTLTMASMQFVLATLLSAQGNHSEALKYDRKAYEYMSAINDSTGIIRTLNGLGVDYWGMGLYKEAFLYYLQAIEKAKEYQDSLNRAITTYNVGRVFIEVGQYSNAKKFLRDSYDLSKLIGDRLGEAYALNDLGTIYLEEGDSKAALEALQTSLSIAEEEDDNLLTPQVLVGLAQFYIKSRELEEALGCYNRAAAIYKKQENAVELAEIQLGKGKIAASLGDNIEAKNRFDKALKTGLELNNANILQTTYAELSNWYEKTGSLRKSLDYLKKSNVLRDSLINSNINQQFAQTLLEYEINKKDEAISELSSQEILRKQQLKNEEFIRNVLVVILAFTAILLFTLYRSSVRRRKTNEQLVTHQKEIEAKSKELESLLSMKDKFFSIISHDLRSPISGLVGILDMLDDGHISQEELVKITIPLRARLDSTRKMLDNLLDWALVEMNEITLKWEGLDLHSIVTDNLAFFKETDQKNVHFSNHIEHGVKVLADRNMLDLILRNLVANSIKFMEENGKVDISGEVLEGEIFKVSVQDNGVGMSANQVKKVFDTNVLYTTRGTANEKGTGLGLKLCKEFVEKMGGTIWVESEEGKGSTFNFTVKRPGQHI